MKNIGMKYEKTKLVDFEQLLRYTIPCSEVPDKSVYPHKPLADQGRFGKNRVKK